MPDDLKQKMSEYTLHEYVEPGTFSVYLWFHKVVLAGILYAMLASLVVGGPVSGFSSYILQVFGGGVWGWVKGLSTVSAPFLLAVLHQLLKKLKTTTKIIP